MIWRRLGALFVGLAFVFATTEPLGHHHCPVHDGIVSDMDGSDMDAMAGHHMPAPSHSQTPEHSQDPEHSQSPSHSQSPEQSQSPSHSQSPEHSHQCTCLGASCCAVAITTPSDRLVALPVIPVKIVRTAAVARSADERPTSHEDVLLPPPIGPPESLPV
jgi:hypothetical protein